MNEYQQEIYDWFKAEIRERIKGYIEGKVLRYTDKFGNEYALTIDNFEPNIDHFEIPNLPESPPEWRGPWWRRG